MSTDCGASVKSQTVWKYKVTDKLRYTLVVCKPIAGDLYMYYTITLIKLILALSLMLMYHAHNCCTCKGSNLCSEAQEPWLYTTLGNWLAEGERQPCQR